MSSITRIGQALGFWNDNSGLGINCCGNAHPLASPQLVEIHLKLQSILADSPESFSIDTPQMVVVGTQSSGKSSLLNSMIQMDILPTGNQMVTRAPLQLQLITSSQRMIEFGTYQGQNGKWKTHKKIPIEGEVLSAEEQQYIRAQIETSTLKTAGQQKNISHQPIHIKVSSPHVPHMTLIDLPGLTMVACTDQGQPKDIKNQIRQLVSSYIQSERTIILAVMPARSDLEADPALDLIKEYDPHGLRTLGILTKVDLMNEDTDIVPYLEGNISIDLQLHHGYFAVRNRTQTEMETLTLQEAWESEKKFFEEHVVYQKISNEAHTRLGLPAVTRFVSQLYYQHIKKLLPNLLDEIQSKHHHLTERLHKLGQPLPVGKEQQKSYLYHLISQYCQLFRKAIEDKLSPHHIGRELKEYFIQYRHTVGNLHPFDQCTENYFENAIRNCEGNHMSFPTPPIEVLEHCLRDPTLHPFQQLTKPAETCLEEIVSLLQQLSQKISQLELFKRFPKLGKSLSTTLNKMILTPAQEKTRQRIIEWGKQEDSYIWTDDPFFQEELVKISKKSGGATLPPQSIKHILETYFECVTKQAQHALPKCIMYFLIQDTLQHLEQLLEILTESDPNELLYETDQNHQVRVHLSQYQERLSEAQKHIQNFLQI